jgi:integrase
MNSKKTLSIQYPFSQKTPFGSVNIYRQCRGRTRFFVTWTGEKGRRRAAFDREAEAHQRAEEIIDDFRKGVSLRSGITAAKAVRIAEYDKLLAGHNMSLGDAVRHFVAHLGSTAETRKDAMEGVREYLASFEEQSSRSRNYSTARSICLRFGRAFGKTLDSITLRELDTYLRGVSDHGRTRNNHLDGLKTFFKWAQKWGYMPAGEMPVNKLGAFKQGNIKIDIFAPDELRKLMNAAGESLLPYLVLGAFAGIRTAEIGRMNWDDIRLDERVILLDAAKTKTNRRRMPLICPNLAAWLALLKGDKTGPVRDSQTKFHLDRAEMCEKAGVTWKHNGLRKSYISYRMAQPDATSEQVAKQCGTSADMIEEYYKGLVAPSLAEGWFSMQPEGDIVSEENVVAYTADKG